MLFFENIFMPIFGHALADFMLQPEAMGSGKNRNDKIHDKEHSLFPAWCYWLTANASVHGGIVWQYLAWRARDLRALDYRLRQKRRLDWHASGSRYPH
jgi:hypothetical protein